MATLSELQTDLAELRAARTKILTGAQSYKSGPFETVRADLVSINKEIQSLELRIAVLQSGPGASASTVVFGGHRG